MNEHDLMQALERRVADVSPTGAPVSDMVGRADKHRKRRNVVTAVAGAAAVAIVATTASVVGLGDDKASAPDVVSPGGQGETFVDALAVVPEGTESVYFNDPVAAAARLGLSATTVDEYNRGLIDYFVGTTGSGDQDPGGLLGPSSVYFERMSDLPFNEFGVLWAVEGISDGGGSVFTIYKMKQDVDFDAIAEDLLAAGLEEDNLLGRRHLFADNPRDVISNQGIIGDGYPLEFKEVTIDPDAGLLIVGNQGERILEVLDGDRESAAEAGTYDTLVGGVEGVERAALVTEGEPCLERLSRFDLQKAAQSGHLVYGDDVTLTARLAFADTDMAARDLEARRDYLDTATFGVNDEPLASIGTADLTVDDSVITIELEDMSSEDARDLTSPPGILSC